MNVCTQKANRFLCRQYSSRCGLSVAVLAVCERTASVLAINLATSLILHFLYIIDNPYQLLISSNSQLKNTLMRVHFMLLILKWNIITIHNFIIVLLASKPLDSGTLLH